MKINKVSLFMPRDTPWYQGIIRQIARGFRFYGIEVSYLCELLGEPALMLWVQQYRPQLIIEMNRSRQQIPFLPDNIIHICWVVDFNGRTLAEFGASEITYLFGPKWVEKYPYDSYFRWFGPGACDQDYYLETNNHSFEQALSFIGHIPRPWSEQELSRNISSDAMRVTFKDLLPYVTKAYQADKESLKVHQDYIQLINTIAMEVFSVSVIYDHKLEYDLTGRLIRLLNRKELIDTVLKQPYDLALYGPENWAMWPEYSANYQVFLNSPEHMRQVFNSSCISLHEGNGMHFRVMDGMMSGALMFVRKTAYDEQIGGIKTFFQPDKHYVEFDLDDVDEKISFYLSETNRANNIRRNAIAEMKKNHSWRTRVKDILNDVMQIKFY